MRKQTGITLIALIITIIVMMILVGVAVSVVMQGGLFDKATIAVIKQETATMQEYIVTKGADMLADKAKDGDELNVTVEETLQAYGMTLTEINFEETPDYISNVDVDPEGTCYLLDASKLHVNSSRGNGTAQTGKDIFVVDSNKRVYYIKEGNVKTQDNKESIEKDDLAKLRSYFGLYPIYDDIYTEEYATSVKESVWQLIDTEDGGFLPNDILPDAKDIILITSLSSQNKEEILAIQYFEYNLKAYKLISGQIQIDLEGNIIMPVEGLELVDELSGLEGKKVKYSKDNTSSEWTVFSDNGDTVEIILNGTLGEYGLEEDNAELINAMNETTQKTDLNGDGTIENLDAIFTEEELQYIKEDQLETFKKAIYLHSNGAKLINEYCIKMVKEKINSDIDENSIRNIGYNTQNGATNFTSSDIYASIEGNVQGWEYNKQTDYWFYPLENKMPNATPIEIYEKELYFLYRFYEPFSPETIEKQYWYPVYGVSQSNYDNMIHMWFDVGQIGGSSHQKEFRGHGILKVTATDSHSSDVRANAYISASEWNVNYKAEVCPVITVNKTDIELIEE